MRNSKAVGLRDGEIGCFWCGESDDLVGYYIDRNGKDHEVELSEGGTEYKICCRDITGCADRIVKERGA